MRVTWPAGHPRVLVTDAWLPNAGDGAIALAVERMIRAFAPNAAVLHAAYHADLVGHAYPELAFTAPLSSLLGVTGAPVLPHDWTADESASLVHDVDLVICQGGGFLLEHYQPWERLFALEEVARSTTPLVLLGHTIGLFRLARARALLRSILRRAQAVTVRDAPSLQHALELGMHRERVALTADMSFTLFDEFPRETTPASGVAVVLTEHEQLGGADTIETRRTIARQLLAEVVERTIDDVVLVSSVQGLAHEGLEDDAAIAADAVAALPAAQRARVTTQVGYLGPTELINVYSRQRAVVSQRLHPALFALVRGVPAALVLAGDKARTLDGATLGALVCRAPHDDRARVACVEAALDADAPRGRALWDVLAPTRERARVNAELLGDVFRSLET